MGGLDLNSSSSGCVRLGSGVAPPLGVVEKEVAVLIVLVRRHHAFLMARTYLFFCVFFAGAASRGDLGYQCGPLSAVDLAW